MVAMELAFACFFKKHRSHPFLKALDFSIFSYGVAQMISDFPF